MRSLFRLLPIVFTVLLFVIIYLGAKKTYSFYNANKDAYYSSLVTENSNTDESSETYDENDRDSAVKKSNQSPQNEADKMKNAAKQELTSTAKRKNKDIEASLDAELEGKSSNQIIAAIEKKADTPKKKSTKKVNVKKKSKVAATAERKKKNLLRAKGAAPKSYEVGSENMQFLVIAGAFKSLNNANNFVDDLEHKKLKNIEILKFNDSTLNSVCISRHNDYNTAKAITKSLKKQHNIDAYVRPQPMN